MWLLLLTGLASVQASSTGFDTYCNVWSNYGSYDQTNNGNIMWWATNPVRDLSYTLRTADTNSPLDDPWIYQPDTIITLYLDVLQVTSQYRGLLLYAVNQTEHKVGSWSFPETVPPTFQLAQGPGCEGQAVVHAQASNKGYREIFYFHTPPKGTGHIKFRLLLKRGGPNVGSFVYPMREDLQLVEADPDELYIQATFTGQAGQTCDEVCKGRGTTCNGKALLEAHAVGSSFEDEIANSRWFTCFKPLMQDCSIKVPVVDDVNANAATTTGFTSCTLPIACELGETDEASACAQVSDRVPICPCQMPYRTVGEEMLAKEQQEEREVEAMEKELASKRVMGIFMWIFFGFSIVFFLYIWSSRRKLRHIRQITIKSAPSFKNQDNFDLHAIGASVALQDTNSLSSSQSTNSRTTKTVALAKDEWSEAVDTSSGTTYYINNSTGESTWTKPEGL